MTLCNVSVVQAILQLQDHQTLHLHRRSWTVNVSSTKLWIVYVCQLKMGIWNGPESVVTIQWTQKAIPLFPDRKPINLEVAYANPRHVPDDMHRPR